MLMLARMPANRAVDRRQLVGGTPDLATIEFWVASGQVQDALFLACLLYTSVVGGFGGRGHVRALSHHLAAVRHERLGVLEQKGVLTRAGQCDICLLYTSSFRFSIQVV